MRATDIIELLALAALWGASFLFMRVAGPEFGAIAMIEVRTAIAALCLLPLLLMARQLIGLKTQWRHLVFVGVTNTAVPFCLFAYCTLYMQAGAASILNATAPMFAAVVAFVWLKDKLTSLAVVGLAVGFMGVAVLTLTGSAEVGSIQFIPALAALAATFLYGVASNYTKRHLQGVSPLLVATGSQLYAALLLLPLSLAYWPAETPSVNAWLQVAVLAIAGTALAYILYFRLIKNIGAPSAITVAYLVPVFGVLWGMIFLDEVLTPGMAIGAGLILLGVSLTTGIIKQKKKLANAH